MTVPSGSPGQDAPGRRFMRALRRWGTIFGVAALAAFGPYAPPPPPPPVPKIEARAQDGELGEEDDQP